MSTSSSHSVPNTPKLVPPETVDSAHPAPDPEGSNATQPEPAPLAHPDTGAEGTFIKRSPYTSGNA